MTRSRRPARAAIAVAAATLATVGLPWSVPLAHAGEYTSRCPSAESLVRGTTWHTHRLAPGVVLKEGSHNDARGVVKMHVLTVSMTAPGVYFHPLYRHVAQRVVLSQLAGNRTHLVAATNTGFFDFERQAPLGPLVGADSPVVASATPSAVVGISTLKRVQAGSLALSGSIAAAGQTKLLAGVNLVSPRSGLTVYTPQWGSYERISLPSDAVSRYVANGQVSSGTGRYSIAPRTGYLVVARGQSVTSWLRSLRRGEHVALSRGVASNTRAAFTQAYSVSSQLVVAGHARTGFMCRRIYPQPARTAVGFANAGRTLIIAIVEDHPGSSRPVVHGLDNDQMSRVMADLGAYNAYAWDGSGSSELLARMPATRGHLTRRTYPADGEERPMPVGFGIFSKYA